MNCTTYIGILTRDVELRGKDNTVASTGLAVKRAFHREGEPDCDFMTLTVMGQKRAENFAKYLHHKSKVWVSGRTQLSSYKNQKGETVSYMEVFVNDFELLDPKPAGGTADGSSQNAGAAQQRPVQQSAPWEQPAQAAPAQPRNSNSSNFALPDEGSLPWEQ